MTFSNRAVRGGSAGALALLLAACAPPAPPADVAIGEGRAATATFDCAAPVVHAALLEAFKELSCRVSEDTPVHVRASFPTGEVVDVYLRESSGPRTGAWVQTHITWVGGAHQMDRSSNVIWALKRCLRESKPGAG